MALDFVDLPEQLRGKEGQTLRLRFVPEDIKAICRNLTPLQARGDGKVTPNIFGRLLLGNDQDAYEFGLLEGLRHSWKKVDLIDVQRALREAIAERGMQYSDLRRPMLKALIACGLADLEVIIKALDEAEGVGGNAGASSTSSSASPTMTSTRPLSVVDSAS
jgi:hypothetical protein